MVCFCKGPRSWRVAHVQLLGAEKMSWTFMAPCFVGFVFWRDWLPVLYMLHDPMQEPSVCTTNGGVNGFQSADRKIRLEQTFHGFKDRVPTIRNYQVVSSYRGHDDDLVNACASRSRGRGFIQSRHDFSKKTRLTLKSESRYSRMICKFRKVCWNAKPVEAKTPTPAHSKAPDTRLWTCCAYSS
jgi:hypothetical protein